MEFKDKKIENILLELNTPLKSLYQWADVLNYLINKENDITLSLYHATEFINVVFEQLQNTTRVIDELACMIMAEKEKEKNKGDKKQ